MLARAQSKAGLGNEYRLLFTQFPQIKAIAERLAWYLTDRMPIPVNFDRPMLGFCLKRGWDMMRSEQSRVGDRLGRAEVMTALLAGLLRPVAMLAELEVSSPSGNDFWDPFVGEPLGDFVRRYGEPVFTLVEPTEEMLDINPVSMRLIVASKIMNGSDIAAIGGSLEAISDFRAV